MSRQRILFQGSHSYRARVDSQGRHYRPENLAAAEPLAKELGEQIISAGFDIILTGGRSLDAVVGAAAVDACSRLGVDPRERIRTYPHGMRLSDGQGYGLVLEPSDRRWQEVRTFVVKESDAVVSLMGGKGTSDCLQKAVLAGKPVLPIAVAGGGSWAEWERLRQQGYFNRDRGDLDFLGDKSIGAKEMARFVVEQCQILLRPDSRSFSRRIFVIHGHDDGLKIGLARFLENLEFIPVILNEQADQGRSILSKLQSELKDVGYAFALLTPDDMASNGTNTSVSRARQNVVFEHGMLVGMLGPDRVCAIVKGEVELPSDLHGILYKKIGLNDKLDSIAVELIRELKAAGYDVDANKL